MVRERTAFKSSCVHAVCHDQCLTRTPRWQGENVNYLEGWETWWRVQNLVAWAIFSHLGKKDHGDWQPGRWLPVVSTNSHTYHENLKCLANSHFSSTFPEAAPPAPESNSSYRKGLPGAYFHALASTGCEFWASVPWHLLNTLNIISVCVTFPHLNPRVRRWTHQLGFYRDKHCFTRSQIHERKKCSF